MEDSETMPGFALRPGCFAARLPAGRSAALAVALLLGGCGSGLDSRLHEIRALQDAGRFEDSIEPLRALLVESAELPEANHRLGVALVQTGQPALAVWPLERSARSSDYAVSSGLLLASVLLSINAPDDAARAASHVLEIDPARADALRIRAQAHLAAGQKEAALADAEQLSRRRPDDFEAAFLLGDLLADQRRLDEAEAVYLRVKALAGSSGDPALVVRGCLALARFVDEARGDVERAEKEYAGCLASHPTEPLVLQLATRFFDAANQPEKATAVWRKAVNEAPENLSFRTVLAARIAASGTLDEAQGILTSAVESLQTPGAWQVLAEFQRRHARTAEAARSLERAAELAGGGDDALRFALGDVYVELGQREKAEEMVSAIDEPAYRELLRGHLLLAKGDPVAALEALDVGIRRWPNNARARYLVGIAARDAGDGDRAIDELREAVRADAGGSDASLALAGIYLARGEWTNAVQSARLHLGQRDPASVPAFRVWARAATAAKQYDVARAALDGMSRVPGAALATLLERAAVERAVKGPAAARATLEGAKLDLEEPAHEPVLRALVEYLVEENKSQRALQRIDAALAAHAGSASLLELRAATLARMGRTRDGTSTPRSRGRSRRAGATPPPA